LAVLDANYKACILKCYEDNKTISDFNFGTLKIFIMNNLWNVQIENFINKENVMTPKIRCLIREIQYCVTLIKKLNDEKIKKKLKWGKTTGRKIPFPDMGLLTVPNELLNILDEREIDKYYLNSFGYTSNRDFLPWKVEFQVKFMLEKLVIKM